MLSNPQDLTLADLFHLPYGNLLTTKSFINLEDEKRPNVARSVICLQRVLLDMILIHLT